MKKNFIVPELNVSLFDVENIVTGSDTAAQVAENGLKGSTFYTNNSEAVKAILTF